MLIKVEREVPYFKGIENKCEYNDGDFWGVTVCPYHTFRDRFHGRKAPAEYHKPKCTLFNEWLKSDYTKCDACLQKCKEAKEDSNATD